MNDLYESHLRSSAYRVERAEKAEVILALCAEELADAGVIGDLGAGTGIIKTKLEASLRKPLIGFDADESFIVDRERMAVADVLALPVGDGGFDFLLLNHLYEHVEDQSGLFREAYRVLRVGGKAYVSAGNRLTLIEPHYRLPFLSWLPVAVATRYLRLSRRGGDYADIHFRTYRPLLLLMRRAGFRVHDMTERAVDDLLGDVGDGRGRGWRPVWKAVSVLPAAVRRRLLQALSPQWFFLLEKPGEPGRPSEDQVVQRTDGRPGE